MHTKRPGTTSYGKTKTVVERLCFYSRTEGVWKSFPEPLFKAIADSYQTLRTVCTLVTEVCPGIKRAVSRRSSARSFCNLLLSFLDLVSGVDHLLVFPLCCLLEFCNVCLVFKRQVFAPLECRDQGGYSCLWLLCAACRIFSCNTCSALTCMVVCSAQSFTQPTTIQNQFHLFHFGFGGRTPLFCNLWSVPGREPELLKPAVAASRAMSNAGPTIVRNIETT